MSRRHDGDDQTVWADARVGDHLRPNYDILGKIPLRALPVPPFPQNLSWRIHERRRVILPTPPSHPTVDTPLRPQRRRNATIVTSSSSYVDIVAVVAIVAIPEEVVTMSSQPHLPFDS